MLIRLEKCALITQTLPRVGFSTVRLFLSLFSVSPRRVVPASETLPRLPLLFLQLSCFGMLFLTRSYYGRRW